MRVPERNLAVGVGVGIGAALVGWWAWRRMTALSFLHEWEEVGEVSELIIYPVKSARGIKYQEADATKHGLSWKHLEDRSLMVIKEDGTFITCRQVDALASIITHWSESTLTLSAVGMEDISLDLDRGINNQTILETNMRGHRYPGVDCGDRVAEWLSNFLYEGNTKVRLVFKANVMDNRPARRPDYFNFKNYRKTDLINYMDYASYLVCTQSSLDDLNSRLEQPVTSENFRPNIVVKRTKAYDEDDWAYVKIGQVILRRVKQCERCLLVTIDPIKGKRHTDMEPLATLKKYRVMEDPPELAKAFSNKPIFGAIMGIDVTGPIAVGNKVSIVRASKYPHLRGY